ncbi:hypothetical protein [Spirosoma areae]
MFPNPRVKRFFWSVLATLSTMLVMLTAMLLLQGCMTFQKAQRKFATNVADTTFTTITTVVPKDSAVLRIVTDTTTVVHEIRQGRAKIIYQRDPKMTIIKAECDSVVIEKRVPVYVTKQVWGVDPAYKDQANTRLAIIKVLLGIILAGVLAYLFAHRLLLSVSISKRGNGTAA